LETVVENKKKEDEEANSLHDLDLKNASA